MKKILTIIAAAAMFAACSNDELETKKDVVITDTSGMYKSNYSTDVPEPTEEQKAPVAQTKVIRETRVVYVDRTPKTRTVREASPVVTEPVNTVPPVSTGTQTNTGANTGTVSTNTGNGSTTSAPAEEPVKKEKEGWSNAAKDAVIGGVVGGVGGAIISKKKVKGAIIGGIIGAAGGYILGKKKDKADAEKEITPQYTSY